MKIKLIFLTLLFASANVRSIVFDPGYTTPASPELTVTQLEPPTKAQSAAIGNLSGVVCKMAVSLPDPDGTGKAYYYVSQKYPKTWEGRRTYCHGVELTSNDAVKNYQILAAAFEGERLALSGPLSGPQKCYWIIYILAPNPVSSGSTGPMPCVSRPISKSCTVTVDDVIFHPNATVGRISSAARGTARIRCTGAVSVRLSTNGTGVRLFSGTTAIESALYLNNDGQTEWNGKVDNTAKIDLISSIDEYTVAAGEYIGSTVLTASWD